MVNIDIYKTMKNYFAKQQQQQQQQQQPVFDLSRSGHALAAIGAEFPLELIQSDPRTALITLALLFSNSNPMRCENFGLASTQLALFAAAPHAGIDAKHYDQLRKTVNEYRDYCLQLLEQEAIVGSMVAGSQNLSTSIDQADGFADENPQLNDQEDIDIICGYDRMVTMLTFILAAAEAIYELQVVRRSVAKQLKTKNQPSNNSRAGNVFLLELPETSKTVTASVMELLKEAGWHPVQLGQFVIEVRGNNHK
ncbi:hypothetical protein BH10CYA1_BH10CYA1_32320 [soil metagenome]